MSADAIPNAIQAGDTLYLRFEGKKGEVYYYPKGRRDKDLIWLRCWAEQKGRVYFYNKLKKETVWHLPDITGQSAAGARETSAPPSDTDSPRTASTATESADDSKASAPSEDPLRAAAAAPGEGPEPAGAAASRQSPERDVSKVPCAPCGLRVFARVPGVRAVGDVPWGGRRRMERGCRVLPGPTAQDAQDYAMSASTTGRLFGFRSAGVPAVMASGWTSHS